MQRLYQRRGQIVQDWLTYPTEPCPIPRCTLTFWDLSQSRHYTVEQGSDKPLPEGYEANFPADLPASTDNLFRQYLIERDTPQQEWYGFTAPGMMLIESIKREETKPPRTDPPMSAVSMAVYTHRFNVKTLRYVIFAHVVNEEARLAGRRLYDLYRAQTDTQTWEYDTPGYQTFLGTRLGKLVAYMLLGAFDRGIRRIARIVTWTNPSFDTPWIRFDIEPVSSCDVPLPSIEPADPIVLPRTLGGVIGEGSSMEELLPAPCKAEPAVGYQLVQPGQQPDRTGNGRLESVNRSQGAGQRFDRLYVEDLESRAVTSDNMSISPKRPAGPRRELTGNINEIGWPFQQLRLEDFESQVVSSATRSTPTLLEQPTRHNTRESTYIREMAWARAPEEEFGGVPPGRGLPDHATEMEWSPVPEPEQPAGKEIELDQAQATELARESTSGPAAPVEEIVEDEDQRRRSGWNVCRPFLACLRFLVDRWRRMTS